MDTGTAKSGKRAGHVPGRGHEQYPLEPMRLQKPSVIEGILIRGAALALEQNSLFGHAPRPPQRGHGLGLRKLFFHPRQTPSASPQKGRPLSHTG
jgi:hypothetical protein